MGAPWGASGGAWRQPPCRLGAGLPLLTASKCNCCIPCSSWAASTQLPRHPSQPAADTCAAADGPGANNADTCAAAGGPGAAAGGPGAAASANSEHAVPRAERAHARAAPRRSGAAGTARQGAPAECGHSAATQHLPAHLESTRAGRCKARVAFERCRLACLPAHAHQVPLIGPARPLHKLIGPARPSLCAAGPREAERAGGLLWPELWGSQRRCVSCTALQGR